jgi:phosphoribosyl 1,2-cyclic phosphodiesterase
LRAGIPAVTAKPIRHVINTHTHPDHVFGKADSTVAALSSSATRNQPSALAARGQFYLDRSSS